MPENIGVQPAEIFQRRGDDGEIHQSGTQSGECLRRGMVGDAQADARICAMERAKHGQKQAVQGGFACADGNDAAFQTAIVHQFFFARLNLFAGDGNARKELFSLRRQGYAAVASDKERTAQNRFQIAYRSGQVRLAAHQGVGGAGEAAELGDGIKGTVGVVTDDHADTLLVYSLVICLKYHLYIFHIAFFVV